MLVNEGRRGFISCVVSVVFLLTGLSLKGSMKHLQSIEIHFVTHDELPPGNMTLGVMQRIARTGTSDLVKEVTAVVQDTLSAVGKSVANSTALNTQNAAPVDHQYVNYTRPPLESIIQMNATSKKQRRNVTGDPQFLLDFAILGFPKCGTSTMMTWVRQHPEAQCFPEEVPDLMHLRPDALIERLYNKLPEGNYKRGYKNPADLEQKHVLRFIGQYWPKTSIIVGVRHPVRWFESFYNFRVNNYGNMPPATKVIGPCYRGMKGCCTSRGLFHIALARLGKTNMTGPEEREIKQRHPRHFRDVPPPLPNKVFLFDTAQLVDTNETRTEAFRTDMQRFLGLKAEMPPVPHSKPGKKWGKEKQALVDSKKIDICDAEYDKLRVTLMGIAKPASVWIRKYFVASKDVVVSSREYFEEIMESWMHDPCDSVAADKKR